MMEVFEVGKFEPGESSVATPNLRWNGSVLEQAHIVSGAKSIRVEWLPVPQKGPHDK